MPIPMLPMVTSARHSTDHNSPVKVPRPATLWVSCFVENACSRAKTAISRCSIVILGPGVQTEAQQPHQPSRSCTSPIPQVLYLHEDCHATAYRKHDTFNDFELPGEDL